MNHHRTVRVFLRAFLAGLFGLLALLLLSPPSVRAEDGDNWRYGVIESDENPTAATRLGVSWTRTRFQWADVQPDGPDDWEPPLDDEMLEAEIADGRMVVGLLIGIPDWARDDDLLPSGLYLPPDDPDNLWAAFVREAVTRYAGQIDHWVIWNEPDITDADAPGHTWDGSSADFAQLVRVAYLVAKEANPDAVIHLGAFTYFWDPAYFGQFLDDLLLTPGAADNNHYFDVATAHLYFQPSAIYDVIRAFQDDMARRGLWKPIWLVETNAPPADDTYWPVPNWTLYVTQYEQAAFIPQAMASALAAGVERLSVYKLMDTDSDREANPEPFGLLRQDNSRRPAFDTYAEAIRRFGRVLDARRERWDAVGQIRLEQQEQTTTVLFSRLPQAQQATVLAEAAEAQLIDMWGKETTIEAEAGLFTVDLPGALCVQTIGDYCMIGGTTYYLVQERGPRWRENLPLNDVIGDIALPPMWVATPTPAPETVASPATATTATPRSTPSPTPTSTPRTEAAADSLPATAPADDVSATPAGVAISDAMEQQAGNQAAGSQTPASAVNEYSGLVFIGLGILLAMGTGGWWFVRRRRQSVGTQSGN